MMKMLTTAAVALCLLVLVGCDAADSETPPTPDTEILNANNRVEANIEGMDCTGCSSSVVAAIEKIDGVKAAWADVKTGDVKVALEDDADTDAKLSEIKTVIAELNEGKYKVISTAALYPGTQEPTLILPDAEEPAEQEAVEAPAADEKASTEPAEEVFVFTSYKVTGMDCSGCSSQIVNAVKQVDGVKQVEADHMTGAVKVSFKDRFDDKKKTDEIKDLIAGLSDGKYTVSY